jgi:hypothetical protein
MLVALAVVQVSRTVNEYCDCQNAYSWTVTFLTRWVRPFVNDIVEIRYSGMKDVYKTKSFRCRNSGTRLYVPPKSLDGCADRMI